MNPSVAHRLLAASVIDLADQTYFFAPEAEHLGPDLVRSIREYGILHPPLVQYRPGNEHIVVAGRKRLEVVLTLLHWDAVPCIVVPADCPELYLHSLLLEQSLLGSPLSLAEQSGFLASLRRTCGVGDILPLLAKLGHKPNNHSLDELLGLRALEPSALLALHRGTLTLASALKLRRFPRAGQDTLVGLISRFQLGGSKQQKLIDLATELLRRGQEGMAEIIAPFLDKIASTRQDNLPQQAAALLALLSGQCFPRSTQAEQEFSGRVARLNLPAGMQVTHSPSFEEESVTLALTFADWDALWEILPALRQLLAEQ